MPVKILLQFMVSWAVLHEKTCHILQNAFHNINLLILPNFESLQSFLCMK